MGRHVEATDETECDADGTENEKGSVDPSKVGDQNGAGASVKWSAAGGIALVEFRANRPGGFEADCRSSKAHGQDKAANCGYEVVCLPGDWSISVNEEN